ncbi:MAG: hypothetical protein D6705_17130 [Deltaproteobacteria bacterium]|nr:MAG: hypothetical protein D6705_17130 [Deltaproteobacteria bacterium]
MLTMERNATPTRWVAALAVLAAAGAGAWLLARAPEPRAAAVAAERPAERTVPRFVARPAAKTVEDDDTEAPASFGEVRGNGRTEPVVDFDEEHAEAARAYRERIASNIAHLEEKARIARAEGNPQRAELMEKRIAGLFRRLAEFEADVAEAP